MITFDMLSRPRIRARNPFAPVIGFEPIRQAAPAPVAERPAAGWLVRLDRWLWRQELRAREGFLAQATDVCDLERRMHLLERPHHS